MLYEVVDAKKMEEIIKVGKEIKAKYVPQNAEGKVWAHGLNFISREGETIKHFREAVSLVNSGAELSVAKDTQANKLGSIGLFIKGNCSLMVNGDCGSYTFEGKRYTKNLDNEFVIDYNELNDNNGYCEAFVAPTEIVGAFVNKARYDKFVSTTVESYIEAYGEEAGRDLYELEFQPMKNDFLSTFDAINEAGIPITFI